MLRLRSAYDSQVAWNDLRSRARLIAKMIGVGVPKSRSDESTGCHGAISGAVNVIDGSSSHSMST